MARTNNLTNFLTDVATAIKTKTGDNTPIPASQFDTKILEGSTPATIYPPDWSEIGYSETPQAILDDFDYSKDIKDNWNSGATSLASKFSYNKTLKYMPLLDTSSVTNMTTMFENCTNLTVIPELNTSNVTDMSWMFNNCTNLTTMPLLDTSSVTNMNGMFSNCTNLTTMPLLDTSSVTNMNSMFYNCTNLTTIPLLDTSSVTNMNSMFSNCTNLTTIPELNTSNVTKMYYMFSNCPNLTDDSLNIIMQMCINAVKITSNKTLKYIGLSSDQANKCKTLSNYSAFTSAGWTTGY